LRYSSIPRGGSSGSTATGRIRCQRWLRMANSSTSMPMQA
jgi:hypothetical protein